MSVASEKATPTIEETIALLKEAYAGESDKSGQPKYLHSIRVKEILPERVGEEIKLAAILHDLIEDKKVTEEELRERGYSDLTVDIVKLLSRNKKEQGYQVFVNNIIEDGLVHRKDLEGAILIKYADICHNTSPERLQDMPKKEQRILNKKYNTPKIMLRMAVKALGYEDFDPCRSTGLIR